MEVLFWLIPKLFGAEFLDRVWVGKLVVCPVIYGMSVYAQTYVNTNSMNKRLWGAGFVSTQAYMALPWTFRLITKKGFCQRCHYHNFASFIYGIPHWQRLVSTDQHKRDPYIWYKICQDLIYCSHRAVSSKRSGVTLKNVVQCQNSLHSSSRNCHVIFIKIFWIKTWFRDYKWNT